MAMANKKCLGGKINGELRSQLLRRTTAQARCLVGVLLLVFVAQRLVVLDRTQYGL
jgi:hypothetical protein